MKYVIGAVIFVIVLLMIHAVLFGIALRTSLEREVQKEQARRRRVRGLHPYKLEGDDDTT